MSELKKIDQLIEEKSLLKHPFYQKWNDGELTKEELAGYALEYFQLVKAVPEFMEEILANASNQDMTAEEKAELLEHLEEERSHIEPWRKFASSLGVDMQKLDNYSGLEKTKQSIAKLRELMTDFKNGASAMYALEKELPKISETKLDGLAKFYGMTSKEATEYFELHAEADIRHAASWKKIIRSGLKSLKDAQTKAKAKGEELIQTATKSLDAQNLLLDSCYEGYCK